MCSAHLWDREPMFVIKASKRGWNIKRQTKTNTDDHRNIVYYYYTLCLIVVIIILSKCLLTTIQVPAIKSRKAFAIAHECHYRLLSFSIFSIYSFFFRLHNNTHTQQHIQVRSCVSCRVSIWIEKGVAWIVICVYIIWCFFGLLLRRSARISMQGTHTSLSMTLISNDMWWLDQHFIFHLLISLHIFPLTHIFVVFIELVRITWCALLTVSLDIIQQVFYLVALPGYWE
jgi:hypothetical protein